MRTSDKIQRHYEYDKAWCVVQECCVICQQKFKSGDKFVQFKSDFVGKMLDEPFPKLFNTEGTWCNPAYFYIRCHSECNPALARIAEEYYCG